MYQHYRLDLFVAPSLVLTSLLPPSKMVALSFFLSALHNHKAD